MSMEKKQEIPERMLPYYFLEVAKLQALSSGGKTIPELGNWDFGDTVVATAKSQAAWIRPGDKYVIDRRAGEQSVYLAEQGEKRGSGSIIVGLKVPCWDTLIKQDSKKAYTGQELLGSCIICKNKPVRFFSTHAIQEAYCSIECRNQHSKACCTLMKLDYVPESHFPGYFLDATKCSALSIRTFIESNFKIVPRL